MATVRCFGPRILPLTVSLTALCGIPLGSDQSAPAAPIVSSEKKELTDDDHRILQQFVDECLAITPGTEPFPKQFRIGSDTEGENALQPADVVMAQSFRICQYETTQELYELVMGSNPSRWPGKRNSVETITFANADDFCRKLTAMLRSSKKIAATEAVRLPTEVEWEYCCRAGTTTLFSFGDEATIASDKGDAASTLSEYAWHTGNAGGNDPPVGFLRPNPWKLYDMHGYLWEYVTPDPVFSVAAPYVPSVNEPTGDSNKAESDTGAASTASSADQDLGSLKGVSPKFGGSLDDEPRVIMRGGSWRDLHQALRSASRRTTRASRSSPAIGFRCVIADEPQASSADESSRNEKAAN